MSSPIAASPSDDVYAWYVITLAVICSRGAALMLLFRVTCGQQMRALLVPRPPLQPLVMFPWRQLHFSSSSFQRNAAHYSFRRGGPYRPRICGMPEGRCIASFHTYLLVILGLLCMLRAAETSATLGADALFGTNSLERLTPPRRRLVAVASSSGSPEEEGQTDSAPPRPPPAPPHH